METELPHTRIRAIMKSSVDTGQVTNEVLFLMTKSTEMFLKHFAKESYQHAKKPNNLTYNHLADLVQENDNLAFLLQIIPQKIKVKEFKALLEQGDESSESSSDSE
ncbi:chromatin accessibility complex 16kD protein [Musca domestica]|uniref:Chromatin accessibility complex protein 1 n=1 Tax=Musca domestica TaxID=7370 RepID=A0A1I8NH57_MUSDO|nr:chromatin accessibility complex 16kD protein [Musca domestica]